MKPNFDNDTATVSRKKAQTKNPSQFRVIMLNDDFTSMDFVVQILETVFQKSPAEANQLMWNVHRQGSAVCGIFTKEIAETKISEVHKLAEGEGFPLRCIMEKV